MVVRRINHCFVIGAFMCLTAGVSQAATWHVDVNNCTGSGDGSVCDPFCMIQEAVVAAAGVGDVILIHDGDYPERGIYLYSKQLRIESLNGPDSVRLTGALSDPPYNYPYIMNISGGQTTATKILGLTFANIVPPPDTAGYRAMEISLASPTVENCVFEGFLFDQGGAVDIRGANPVFNDCIFQNNTANDGNTYGSGGAIRIWNYESTPSQPEFTCCTFEGNKANRRGGAIDILGGAAPETHATFDGCLFQGNGAGDGGGFAVFVTENGTTFTDCTFRANYHRHWAASAAVMVRGDNSDTTTFDRCVFENNTAGLNFTNSLDIAGIAADGPYAELRQCRFEGNTGGSTLLVQTDALVTIIECQFINNTVDHGGRRYSASTVRCLLHILL